MFLLDTLIETYSVVQIISFNKDSFSTKTTRGALNFRTVREEIIKSKMEVYLLIELPTLVRLRVKVSDDMVDLYLSFFHV